MTLVLDPAAVPGLLAVTVGTAAAALLVTVVCIRAYGLRSLAKFAPHDFVATVALGSVIAAVVVRSTALWTGLFAIGGVFLVQAAIGRVRRLERFTLVDNDPLLLMVGDRVLHDNLDGAGVTLDDLRAKLREANVIRLDEVRAVVLEGTGDISVLHATETDLDPVLLEGVRGLDDVDRPPTWRDGGTLADTRHGRGG